jgi:hypothetical protein
VNVNINQTTSVPTRGQVIALRDEGTLARVVCPICGRVISIYENGTLYRHDDPTQRRPSNHPGRKGVECAGAYLTVEDARKVAAGEQLPDSTSPFDQCKIQTPDGDRWSLRTLQGLMGYSTYQHVKVPLMRGMQAAANVGMDVTSHFTVSRKTPRGGGPATEDYTLTREAAYLVAMNGDPNKPEIAAAQAYFAVSTIKHEQGETPPAKHSQIEVEPVTPDEFTNQIIRAYKQGLADAKGAKK